MAEDGGANGVHEKIVGLLKRVSDAGLDFIKIENLCTFDGQPGYAVEAGD